MTQFRPLERAVLHRQIRVAVRQGKLPADALALYPRNADFAQTLEEALGGTYDEAASAESAAPGGGGKFTGLLQWLLQNLPQIIQIVMELIAAFGGGAAPSPAPAPAAALKLSAENCDHDYAAAKLGFSLPAGTGALIAEILQAVLPIVEQAVEAAIKKYLPAAPA